jgi:uncharacterized protein YndB with AHSA1/START domain
MDGTLGVTADGRHTLTFVRTLAHPPAVVWRAITEPGQLRAWFVDILDYDRSELEFVAGAKLTFAPKDGTGLPAGHGEVLRCEPPNLLEYTWDAETLRWELTPDGDTGCRLVFINTLPDRETAEAVRSGWGDGLDRLPTVLAGQPS